MLMLVAKRRPRSRRRSYLNWKPSTPPPDYYLGEFKHPITLSLAPYYAPADGGEDLARDVHSKILGWIVTTEAAGVRERNG